MAERMLHAAPPDYGIVEIREPGAMPRFIVYQRGSEIARCGSLDLARALAESDRQHVGSTRGTVGTCAEQPPVSAGRP